MQLHVAAVAQHRQIPKRLIPLVAIPMMHTKPTLRAVAATNLAMAESQTKRVRRSRRQAVIPRQRIPL
jgi:hypothetical protein